MYFDCYHHNENMYIQEFNILDINNFVPSYTKLPINFLKGIVLEYSNNFPTFIKQISKKDIDTYHNKYDDITNFEGLITILLEKNSEETLYLIVFEDQDNNLRSIKMYNDLLPGMAAYYYLHNDIKRDLITIINEVYEDLRDDTNG